MKICISCLSPIFCFVFLLGFAGYGQSAEIGLSFTSQVNISVSSPYGFAIPVGTTFSGHLVFESNTPVYEVPPTGCSDCASYLHKHINGLHVEFPGLTVQANEYVVQVKNDVSVSGSQDLYDVLTFWFPEQSVATPSVDLEGSLRVNGNSVSTGSFRIDLVAAPSTVAGPHLPSTLDAAVFEPSRGSGTFGDGMPNPNSLDVFHKPQSVSAFPHSTSDHDLDGDVDGADFLIWQRYVGTGTHNGDADSNLMVDTTDLELWQAEYSPVDSELTAQVAIPEPGCLSLMASACLVVLCRR